MRITDAVKRDLGETQTFSISHVAVVAASLCLTLSAWHFSNSQIDSRTQARFDAAVQSTVELLQDRMERYEDALWSGVAVMNTEGGQIENKQWRTFANSLRLQDKYPGINGIGVIYFVPREALSAFESSQKNDQPEFAIYPPHEQTLAMPITFIEPLSINRAALGLDIAHETNRREAALASRDTGKAQITGPITLVQDENSTAGFLFYAPFYTISDPDSLPERQANAIGAVYAPFIVNKLMEGLLSKQNRDLLFSIRDDNTMIYDELSDPGRFTDPDPMFRDTINLQLYGRTWTLDLESNLGFRKNNSYVQPNLILFAGLMIEGLIVTILVLMTISNRHAHEHAKHMTKALRTETVKLAKTNEELEQFVYVASHDLKTPVRGIGGLTEMIQEDLNQYFRSDGANPKVAYNLERIHDRVARINDLTDSILAFSKVGRSNDPSAKLNQHEIEQVLRQDFSLHDDTFSFRCDVETIETDAYGFLRVLENLVGNAVKYHAGKPPLQVSIDISREADHLHITVADNGPGIAPEFHQKVFEPFQTLSSNPAAGSTGIGLASVKKCVELHGFSIQLESSPGQGCLFKYCWPHAPKNLNEVINEAA